MALHNDGNQRGKQNYIGANCRRQFIDAYDPPKGYSEAVKRERLKLYVNDTRFRAIERVKKVHHTTIIH
jgi:transposase-like protein